MHDRKRRFVIVKIIENSKTRAEYWEAYYGEKLAPTLPSQFAVFFANEITTDSTVIELGCGNGRDAMFLRSYCNKVIAIDGSIAGIDNCIDRANQMGLGNINFLQSLIDDPALAMKLKANISNLNPANSVHIYSRFFLHSINDDDEDCLVSLVDQLLDNRSGSFFVEFRTAKDEILSKYTGEHYRRYVEPLKFRKKFMDLGFDVDYFVEGVGFAKYKVDDAHVARFVFTKKR